MALTLAQRDALTTDPQFLSRVREAIRAHAVFVVALGPNAPGGQQQWAERALTGSVAATIAGLLVGRLVEDPAIAGASDEGATDVTDTALRAAVDPICEFYG